MKGFDLAASAIYDFDFVALMQALNAQPELVTEVDINGDTLLMIASIVGSPVLVKLLLKSGSNIDHQNNVGNSPLFEAALLGHISVAGLLIDAGCNVNLQNYESETALTAATAWSHYTLVELLVASNAEILHRINGGDTALSLAIQQGSGEAVSLMLGHLDAAEKNTGSKIKGPAQVPELPRFNVEK